MPKLYKENLLAAPHLLAGPHTQHMDEDELAPGGYNPLKTLLFWRAPARPYRKKDRSYYTTVAILLILIALIALLAGEKLLILVLLALGFIVYVLNFIPPEDIDYKISNQGITVRDHFYHWDVLDSFWISEKDGHKLLNVLTLLTFPGMLIIPLGELNEDEIKRVCVRFLPFHEIAPKSLIDKWADSLQKHFPLENPHR
ncbi:hypothetical protein HY025_03330 [Candidatus Daviesbacteria bacterium]|nr:hypothetical protein [Candidatus Daviesbacteria bacterium]